jgi:hypothetical protein
MSVQKNDDVYGLSMKILVGCRGAGRRCSPLMDSPDVLFAHDFYKNNMFQYQSPRDMFRQLIIPREGNSPEPF